MRALVTGGAGFIGSNLVDALLDRGDEVTVVDNLATGRLENLDGARRRGIAFHEADITDAERLRKVFAGARPDIVFHLAAQIDVRKSIEDPAWDASINVGGTINVLEAGRHSGVARVVNTSTGGAQLCVPNPRGEAVPPNDERAGEKRLPPNPKSSKSRSISSENLRMNENGLPPGPLVPNAGRRISSPPWLPEPRSPNSARSRP